MDPGIYQQRAALGGCDIAGAASEAVDAASLDVNARDFGAVVRCEDRELDRTSPGIRGKDRADVVVARTPGGRSVTTGQQQNQGNQ